MNELVYRVKGDQNSFYVLPGGETIPGTSLKNGTILFLRNRSCHLHDHKPNVFEIANEDEHDIYIFLNADQVEYVSGNIGFNESEN